METPAGLESYLREMAAATADGLPDPSEVAEIVSRYDIAPADPGSTVPSTK
jgi:hypothetical protein